MIKPNIGSWNEKGHQIKAKRIWIKYRIYLIIMYWYWLINCYKCTILVIKMKDVVNRRNWAWDIWEISYYFWNFSTNLKQLQNTKKKLIKKMSPDIAKCCNGKQRSPKLRTMAIAYFTSSFTSTTVWPWENSLASLSFWKVGTIIPTSEDQFENE